MQKKQGRGPKGYTARSLFNCYIASYYLGTDSIAETVRNLQDNPTLALACGFNGKLPSRPTLSRFFSRLVKHQDELHRIMSQLAAELRAKLPGFGRFVAIDSTDVPTHASKDRKLSSDPEASWSAKGYRAGSNRKEWHFGYKFHALVDATYEIPITGYTTTGSASDSENLTPLLERAEIEQDWFRPQAVIADKGYDSQANAKAIIEDFGSAPVIPLRGMRPGATKRRRNTEERVVGVIPRDSEDWRTLYAMRTAVERVFGRLKENRRLASHCFRGKDRVATHCLLAVITLQALCTATEAGGASLRQCRRRVA